MTSPRTPAFVTGPYSDDDHRRKQSHKAGALAIETQYASGAPIV